MAIIKISKVSDKTINIEETINEQIVSRNYSAKFHAYSEPDNTVFVSSREIGKSISGDVSAFEIEGKTYTDPLAAVDALNQFINFNSGGGTPSPTPDDWTPPADWPDIKAIFNADAPPAGYQKLGIVLFSDAVRTITLSHFGGSYWKTFDGYVGPSKTYTLDTNLMTPSVEGYRVGWVIMYNAIGLRNIGIQYQNQTSRSAVWIYLDNASVPTLSLSSVGQPAAGCLQLKSFETTSQTTLPTSLGSGSFYKLSQLEKIVLPEGVLSASASMAQDCSKLRFVKLPSTLATLGQSAFLNCLSLREIDLSNVTSLVTSLLQGCTSLKRIIMSPALASVTLNAFTFVGVERLVLSGTVTYAGILDLYATTALIFEGAPTFVSATPFSSGWGILEIEFPTDWIPVNGISISAFRSLAPDNLVRFFERLGDNTGSSTKTLTVPALVWAQLTTAEKAIAPNKNYIVQTT